MQGTGRKFLFFSAFPLSDLGIRDDGLGDLFEIVVELAQQGGNCIRFATVSRKEPFNMEIFLQQLFQQVHDIFLVALTGKGEKS